MSKQTYYDIPAVPGCVYKFYIKGNRRSLMCTSFTDGKHVALSDLATGYPYNWDIKHFSFMVRKQMWEEPSISARQEVTVTHVEQKQRLANTRNYTKAEFDALIDDINDVNFDVAH